jgi:hypothetical protein
MTNELVNDTRFADLTKVVKKLGAESANSALAKPKMALSIVQARIDGVIGDDAGAMTYDIYLEGRRATLEKASSLGVDAEDAGSYKANVSKNTQLLKAGGLIAAGVDFGDVLTQATRVRESLVKAGDKVKPTYDAYVDLARAQLKSPTAQLDEDAISGIVRKKEAAEKELVDKLVAAYKVARKLQEDFPCQPMETAVAAYADAITEAGGDIPAITKEEKKEAAAMAFLASRGVTVQHSNV